MTTTTFQPSTPVGQIAAEQPLATRVFARHDIDFCCAGGTPLAEACAQHDLDPARVLEEIRHETEHGTPAERDWKDASLAEIIDHILEAYHAPLREELPRLDGMARKVLSVHGDKEPEMLEGIVETLAELREELESHMMKEERILFPMIKAGQGAQALGPVQVMEAEHASAGAALARLRLLTGGYRVPEDACATWTALWHGLAAFEQAMHQHIHLENNILFPRALRS